MRRISTIPSCCAEFTSGSGLSFGIGAGIEAPIGLRIAGSDVQLGARIAYQGLSASMQVDEKIGNVISGQNVSDGVSRHDLSIGYAIVGISPWLHVSYSARRNI
jgi:hypothetical protein